MKGVLGIYLDQGSARLKNFGKHWIRTSLPNSQIATFLVWPVEQFLIQVQVQAYSYNALSKFNKHMSHLLIREKTKKNKTKDVT